MLHTGSTFFYQLAASRPISQALTQECNLFSNCVGAPRLCEMHKSTDPSISNESISIGGGHPNSRELTTKQIRIDSSTVYGFEWCCRRSSIEFGKTRIVSKAATFHIFWLEFPAKSNSNPRLTRHTHFPRREKTKLFPDTLFYTSKGLSVPRNSFNKIWKIVGIFVACSSYQIKIHKYEFVDALHAHCASIVHSQY